jgi:hypothetical protein
MTCRLALPLLAVALLLAACAPEPAPTPTPTRTPAPFRASPTPAAPSTATPPAATATAESSPTVAPTPRDVNPLTGLVPADPAVLERRPLAIKISNYPASAVRPLSGINGADVVFEHLAEGGVTRLTGVYLSQDVELIGSVRSCRILDKEIMRMFHAVLACSGLSPGNVTEFRLLPEFAEGRILSPSFGDGAPMFYRRDVGQPAPHNQFTDTSVLWAEAEARGLSARPELRAWTFDPAVPAGGEPADRLAVDYRHPDSQLEWRYDPGGRRWLRRQAGAPFSDRLTGEQTSAANVIVVYALHIDTLIVEDVNGARSVEIQLWGSGELILFRDGQAFPGRWVREDPGYLFAVTDRDGQPIPLQPGNTWVEVVYASATETTDHAGGGWTVTSDQKP